MADFSYINLGNMVTLPISVGGKNFFGDINDKEYLKFYNEPGRHAIGWKYNGMDILKSEKDASVKGYPSTDMNHVIAIYLGSRGDYKAPFNAVIFLADGSFQKRLIPPPFQSNLILENLRINGDSNPPLNMTDDSDLYFDHVSWDLKEGKIVTTVRIVYDREWYETRVLNAETGEFGLCLNSGML